MTTWILLRGLAREAAHWGDFPGHLRRALPSARLLTIDLPGSGPHNAMMSPRSVEGLASHCRAEHARMGGSGPVHLLAMSLGAMVAVQWAAAAPGEIAGCVLINTSMRPFSAFHQRLRPAAWAPLARVLLPGTAPQTIESTILRLTSGTPARHAQALQDWLEIRRTRPVSAANALRQLQAAARFTAPRQPPAVPLLILASRLDRLVDSRCSADIARRWQCPIEWHPDAGHDLPLDDPVWVANAIARWSAR